MNHKTRESAIKALREYANRGVVFQYEKSGRWNWATVASGCWYDIGMTLEDGNAVLNFEAAPHYRIPVKNVEIISLTTAVA